MKAASLLAALWLALGHARAGFTNSFDGITVGASVTLTWDAVPPQQEPLVITAQVIDKGVGGFRANGYRVNITTTATGTSHLWAGAPYPLREIGGGLYQLELRPAGSGSGGETPLLAKSPFFSISAPGAPAGSKGNGGGSDGGGGGNGAISKPVAIGLGVAVGVPSVVGTAVVLWCLRKRHRKASLEKRRLKRAEFVIH
ncbi:hypothetical protein C8A05DRAFT_40997 [Staphylotrichum tortipilum]|uniref:Uncharacterized protein n=1 Tax=Staphylotrichum tortipilum TaxID=2831512 RepID=A0AAN6MS98_9PEZI|nr:hypothetical protein C8A05DRAFT_40997 [Staphylotrichum longicolle]